MRPTAQSDVIVPTWDDIKFILNEIKYTGDLEEARVRFERFGDDQRIRARAQLLELQVLTSFNHSTEREEQ